MKLFKGKPIESYELKDGALRFDFHMDEKSECGDYLRITCPSGMFELKVRNYAMGYLLAAARQGMTDELSSYGLLMARISDEIYQDNEFATDIVKALQRRDKRLLKKAAKEAAKVGDNEELAAQALMRSVLNRAELRNVRKGDEMAVNEMREILNGDEDLG